MTEKGVAALSHLLKERGRDAIGCVIGARDTGSSDNSYELIQQLCIANDVEWLDRRAALPAATSSWKMAVGWRWMIPDSGNLVVLHDSLLPRYRGFAPLVNMLLAKESVIGVTALLAADEYDSGPIIAQRSVAIQYPCRIAEAIATLAPLYGELAVDVFDQVASGAVRSTPQDVSLATFSPWLDDQDYFIDWSLTAEQIERFVDAVGTPYDGAKAFANGRPVRILSARSRGDVVVENRSRHIGKVLFHSDGFPVVICASGLLEVRSVSQLDGAPCQLGFRTRFASFSNRADEES